MRDSGLVSAGEHGCNFRGPHRMLEGETDGRPGSARGTTANRIHNHEHGPALWAKKLVHIFRCPRFFNAVLREIAPHRSEELFRVGHPVILS